MRPPRLTNKNKITTLNHEKVITTSQNDDGSTGCCDTWNKYFDRKITINVPIIPTTDITNKSVLNNETTSSSSICDVFNVYIAGNVHNHILLCLHGGGQTALSWCLVAGLLKHLFCIVAYDCRGHGLTRCVDPNDLSGSRLVNDGLNVIEKIREYIVEARQQSPCPFSDNTIGELSVRDKILLQSRSNGPVTILLGHSLGGAIAIKLASSNKIPNLQGLVILDVVEGTALEALPAMREFVKKFPEQFNSTSEAVEWSLRNILKNRISAEISIPSQLYFNDSVWKWRVPLKNTEIFWEDWFKGISEQFLSAQVGSGGKVLVLVGHERLDKPLTIGHMQGRYQLQVIPKSGHVIEEDQPSDVASVIIRFAEHFRLIRNVPL